MSITICRCEAVSEASIVEAIQELGAVSTNEVKMMTRAGKGACGGRCCYDLVSRIVADETGKQQEDLAPPSVRPPVRPVPMTAAGLSTDSTERLAGNVLSMQTGMQKDQSY